MSKKLICLTAVGLMLAITASAGAQVGKGKVLFEYWLNIGSGTSVDNDLRTNANFPGKPTESEWRDSFKSKVDWADNAGTRARAYLTPPADGDYTFWVSGDDNCQLWLSTDDTAANAVKIAEVTGWTPVEAWDGAGGSTDVAKLKSTPIALKAGKSYYIEGLMKEGGGGDSITAGWTGPVIGDKITVISGQYLTAFIRDPEPLFKATSPDPANGKKEVTSPLFQWTAGATAVMHEVYMGTNPTPGAAEFMGPWPTNMYFHIPGLTPGAKYYWRVDEVDGAGVKTTGDVWNFTVQPLEAHNPEPPDGMMGRALNVQLKWVSGQGAVKHKVLLGTDKDKVTAGDAGVLAAEQAELTFAPASLAGATLYYWRVDEVDSAGKVTAGPVWSFSTVDPTGGAIAEYWNDSNLSFYNLGFMGAPAAVKTVPNVDLSWPDGSVKGTNSPDPAINTNYFAARFTAQLNVPTSGKYKLIESTDDGGRLYLNGKQIAGDWATGGESEKASAELDLVAGEKYLLVLEYFEATGGAAARLRWSGPGITKQAIWQGALMPPQCAISPFPVDRAAEVPDSAVLSFTPGPKAAVHTMYFGTDKTKVTDGDASVALPPTDQATYAPKLSWNTTYYWRVDEMAADGTTIPGQVWSFTTANFLVVGPSQKTLTYDNVKDPFVSQVAYDVPADLTAGGVTDLALRFQGRAPAQGTFSYDAGVYTVGGAGSDIWGNADQFTYAYKALEGDGTMTARVVSDDGKGANEWSKAGVMIRETLAAGSTHAFMPITAGGGNGRSFQRRLVADLASTNADGPAPKITAPYWVRIERKGNDFSGYVSETGDPNSWVQVGTPVTIVMKDPVFIGLAVTSHLAGTVRTWTFDNVSTTGSVVPAGPFSAWKVINTTQNAALPLYASLEDKAGNVATVIHPNATAVSQSNISSGTTVQYVYDLWRIPMSSFQGVDLKNAAKLYFGVGDGTSVGSGAVNFADVRIVKPVVLPSPDAIDVTAKGDALVGLPNDGVGSDALGGWPAAEVPANVIDNDVATKFLHFKGDKESTGFSVTPSAGSTLVTGLTFSTANDTPSRDPVTWEIWGSNTSADGPWEFIAKGAVDDFARTLDWPRRWKNVTPIGFVNILPYLHYRVMFPTVRYQTNGLNNVPNSMQIAEVEILGVPAPAAGLTKVNFQSNSQGDKVVPEGYLPDYGLPFADQGNGYSYGWSRDISADARDRNSKNSLDQRYDTFVHLQKGDPAVWEIAIPDGKYQLLIVGGDPDNTDQTNSFDVEGVIVPDADGQGDRWDTYLVNVTVADGRLTIKPAPGATPAASNSKISFVVINPQ